MGQDFARNDERREKRERGETDHSPSWPVSSGVSRGWHARDEQDGNEQHRQVSPHGDPPRGS
jgi:hypothetical protein